MHFSGKYGAINIAKRGTDNLKTNPNEEQSDSDEREEYLNQQVDMSEYRTIQMYRIMPKAKKINSQAPNTDKNTNTTQTDNAIKSIEISEEDKIPGLLQDEYSDLLPFRGRNSVRYLGSAIGVPIKIVPTISNDANGCYYKGVIYISLSADDKVMTVFHMN